MGTSKRGVYRKDHLSRHRKGWRYKRAVPADLRALACCKEWSEYLGCNDDEARIKASILAARDNARIERFRSLTPDERQALKSRGGIDALTRDTPGWKQYAVRMRAMVNALDDVSLHDAVAQAHGRSGRRISEGDLAAAFQRARVHTKAIEAHVVTSSELLTKLDSDKPVANNVASLVPVWQRISNPRSLDSVHKMHLYAKRFDKTMNNVDVQSVTKQHAIDFRDALEKMPSVRRSMHKHLDALKRLFKVAVGEKLVEVNPFADVSIRRINSDDDDDGKQPFELEQVRQIFDALPSEAEDFQWIVRLLAYHGARSGEICRLGPEDVTESMGIPILRIRRKDNRLKNKHSAREVPIHPACMGIVDYAARAKGRWLFASLPDTWKKEGRAGKFQKAGSAFLRKKVGIADKALTMHCLRHTWKMIALEIDMPDHVSRAIMGHSPGKDDHAKYGKGKVSLRKRADWIARVNPLPKPRT